jgi:thioredoxin 2
MNEESTIVMCPACGAKNRVPQSRWQDQPKCGKCKQTLILSSLFPDKPIDVTDAAFQKEVIDFKGPVLVDFTAPW